MEPIMKLRSITPEENMGDIVGDLKPSSWSIK